MDVELRKHVGIALETILHLQDNPVFVVRSVDRRDLALAVGAVKGAFDSLRCHSQSRCLIAVDDDVSLRILNLQVAGDVRQSV